MTHAASKGESRFSTMAHLFLSDIRSENPELEDSGKNSQGSVGKVKRIKPGERNNSYPPPPQQTDQPQKADPSDFLLSQADPAEGDAEAEIDESAGKLNIIGVHSCHLRWAGNKYLGQFARTLAGQGKVVAVLNLEAWSANLRLYYRRAGDASLGDEKSPLGPKMPELEEYLEDPVNETRLEPELETSGAVWSQLETLAETMDYFLISWGPEFSPFEDRLYHLLDEICIVTSPERDKLVGSYQLLKALKNRLANLPAGVFVGDVGSFSEAQAVYSKLARTCRDFAGIQIENYGYSLSEGAVVQELVARTELRQQPQTWFDDLEKWLQSRREIPAESPLENLELQAGVQPPSVIASEAKQSDPGGMASSARPCLSPQTQLNDETTPDDSLAGDDEDNLVIETAPTQDGLSELIGSRIVAKGKPANDSLMAFLQSIGVNCSRFLNPNGNGTVVLVLKNEEDSAAAAWAMEHYPVREDRLILVTDKQIGQVEKTFWQKYFTRLEIKRLLRGKLHGRQVLIIEK